MKLPIFHVDAFSSKVFGGNPAAVCPLDHWLDDDRMQSIAAENNLSETAFFLKEGESHGLRWFTPTCEVKLCGHATLASAYVYLNKLDPARNSVKFETRSGTLTVDREGDRLALNLPASPPWKAEAIPAELRDGLAPAPQDLWQVKDNYFAIYGNEEDVRRVRPALALLEKLHPFGVCVTAAGKDSDFVSRYFAPSYGISEDPVTGSTHCALTPYWSQVLGKTNLHARQVSRRGGELWCEAAGERVIVRGHATLYLEGMVTV